MTAVVPKTNQKGSIMGITLDNWFKIANAVYIGAVVVAAVATVFVFQISQGISRRDAVEKQAAKDAVELARSDAAKAKVEVAKAQVEQEHLRRENLELAAAVAPRSLEQLNSSRALSPFEGTQAFIVSIPEAEARRLAGAISVMLKMAGWKVEPIRTKDFGEVTDGVGVGHVSGIVHPDPTDRTKIITNFNEKGVAAAKGLVEQLLTNHIEAREEWVPHQYAAQFRGDYPLEALVIKVGLRPITYFDKKAVEELRARGQGNIILNTFE
jgi:hypothetical protein